MGALFPAGTTREARYHEKLNRRFDEMFQKLVAFKQRHGHCDVRLDDGEDGKLRTWVLNRRREYSRGQTTGGPAAAAGANGFSLALRKRVGEKWDRHYTKLVAYKKRFGDCDVPVRWPEDSNFAHWVNNQRCFRRQGILSPERIERLEQLGFAGTVVSA